MCRNNEGNESVWLKQIAQVKTMDVEYKRNFRLCQNTNKVEKGAFFYI